MGEKCPFCNLEHDEILDRVSEEASDIAMEFTEKSFDKIWNLGMASKMAEQMTREDLAKNDVSHRSYTNVSRTLNE